MSPKEPTAEQCGEMVLVGEDEHSRHFAIWYPQMGGYVGKAVAVICKDSDEGSCFDVFVWHDGEFPFSEENPAELHHCSAEQFVRFGEQIAAAMKASKKRSV
jgi:hypothetical protein